MSEIILILCSVFLLLLVSILIAHLIFCILFLAHQPPSLK